MMFCNRIRSQGNRNIIYDIDKVETYRYNSYNIQYTFIKPTNQHIIRHKGGKIIQVQEKSKRSFIFLWIYCWKYLIVIETNQFSLK